MAASDRAEALAPPNRRLPFYGSARRRADPPGRPDLRLRDAHAFALRCHAQLTESERRAIERDVVAMCGKHLAARILPWVVAAEGG